MQFQHLLQTKYSFANREIPIGMFVRTPMIFCAALIRMYYKHCTVVRACGGGVVHRCVHAHARDKDHVMLHARLELAKRAL